MENTIFLGCNYNDKSIKKTFDNLKYRIERDFPVHCIVIDKRPGKTASDLWLDIQESIKSADFCIFDVSAFRPNVVLELGYALAVKNSKKILVSFKHRKTNGEKPTWLLSDIGHLQRVQYSMVKELENTIRKQILEMQYIQNLKRVEADLTKTTDEKYFDYIKEILFLIRDEGSKAKDQVRDYIKGSNLRIEKMIKIIKKYNLLAVDSNQLYVFP